MKKKRNNNATLASISASVDGLAIVSKRGFDDVNEKLDDLMDFRKRTDLTLYNMDRKLQTMDERLDAIEKTLGASCASVCGDAEINQKLESACVAS